MKRLFAILLCAAIIISLTACSGLNALLGAPENPTATEPFSGTEGAKSTEGSEPPVSEPPTTEPPVSEPPVTEPPVSEPPVTEPPVSEPPVTEPPVSEPPVTEPPVSEPPVTEPPVSEPPVSEPPAVVPDPPADPTAPGVTAEHLRRIEEGFLMLVNLERQNCGVGTLTIDSVLDEAAQKRSVEIVELFSHTRPNGEDCFTAIDATRYPYITLGENICYTSHVGTGSYTPADVWVGSDAQIEAAYSWVFTLFKNSPGHYANMIHADFENCGIGVTCRLDQHGIPYFYIGHFFGTKNN